MNFQRIFRRSISRMSSPTTSCSYTANVVSAMRKLYPEKLADSSFDNTGLLLEAPYRPNHLNETTLLTIDLTKAVADEAIRRKDSLIVTYHPIIFRPLKALTLQNTQQNTLLRLAQEGISVYSPHTAIDATPGGLNDFLADIITGKMLNESQPDKSQQHLATITSSTRSVITPVKNAPTGFEAAGYGRILHFSSPIDLGTLVSRIKLGLGLDAISLATPTPAPGTLKSDIKIRSVGICAGSGGSMLMGLDVDLLFTGELSHHEALALVERGKCAVTTFHSNSERAYLPLMKGALEKELKGLDGKATVAISEVDRDPFEVIVNLPQS